MAPTGAGKSLLWCLLLLALPSSISLVITPYTSLGHEGESRCVYLSDLSFLSFTHDMSRMQQMSLTAIFVNAKEKSPETLSSIARGSYRVVFVCLEMLESPAFSVVLHAEGFKACLNAIYVDEAHLVHETWHWRTPYSRLYELRNVVGRSVPLVAISATLPKLYRSSLCHYAAMNQNYTLINLGNHRVELSTVVLPLQHDASSFQDLLFLLPTRSVTMGIPKTIVCCDDLEMLTNMYWLFHRQLTALCLSANLVDILHAGL